MRRVISISMGVGFVLGAAYLLVGIFRSTSSTAAIGFLFLPVWGAFGAAAGGALAFVAVTARDVFSGRLGIFSLRAALGAALLVGGLVWGVLWAQETKALAAAKDPSSSPAELRRLYEGKYFLRGRTVAEALAVNPSVPAALLERMAREGSPWLVALVGANPAASGALLAQIAAAGPPDFNRLGWLASNPNLTRASIERLMAVSQRDFPGPVEYRLYQTYVLAALARRPDLPPDLFERLAAWPSPEHFLVTAILYAPQSSCGQISRFVSNPSEVLANTAASELGRRACEQTH